MNRGHDAVIFTTTCDQMRRAADTADLTARLPVFLLNVPATWQTETARRLYRDEIERLGRFLVQLGGQTPSPGQLAETMRVMGDRRAAHLLESAVRSGNEASGGRVRVALVGSHRLAARGDLEELLAGAGGSIVLDATPNGELGRVPPFAAARRETDPFGTLIDTYFDAIPDAFRRPNTRLYEWLASRLAERGVQGIIFRHYVWCDLWHAEAQRLKEWSNLPVLGLEAGGEEGVSAQNATRIQAFMEMLRRNGRNDAP